MSRDDDRLRFGDLTGDDTSASPVDPADRALDLFKLLFIVLVFGYIILAVAHTLFGTPDPSALF